MDWLLGPWLAIGTPVRKFRLSMTMLKANPPYVSKFTEHILGKTDSELCLPQMHITLGTSVVLHVPESLWACLLPALLPSENQAYGSSIHTISSHSLCFPKSPNDVLWLEEKVKPILAIALLWTTFFCSFFSHPVIVGTLLMICSSEFLPWHVQAQVWDNSTWRFAKREEAGSWIQAAYIFILHILSPFVSYSSVINLRFQDLEKNVMTNIPLKSKLSI